MNPDEPDVLVHTGFSHIQLHSFVRLTFIKFGSTKATADVMEEFKLRVAPATVTEVA